MQCCAVPRLQIGEGPHSPITDLPLQRSFLPDHKDLMALEFDIQHKDTPFNGDGIYRSELAFHCPLISLSLIHMQASKEAVRSKETTGTRCISSVAQTRKFCLGRQKEMTLALTKASANKHAPDDSLLGSCTDWILLLDTCFGLP